jgi:predicted O-methyltransferase YrrM
MFTVLAALGSVLWTPSIGIAAGLVLLAALITAVLLLRNQVTESQRMAGRTVRLALAEETARLREASAEARSAIPVRQIVDSLGQNRLEVTQRFAAIDANSKTMSKDLKVALAQLSEQRSKLIALHRDTRQGFVQVTADAWSIQNLLQIVDIDGVFPPPGGWALTPSTLIELVSLVQSGSPDMFVLECGSGTSTIWLAHCQRIKGGKGRVVSLEHDQTFADATRAYLQRLGLDEWAEVRHAPLTEIEVEGVRQDWYDPKALIDIPDIDLLVVDGPPWRTAEAARYPAFPILAPSLATGAIVALDDVTRDPEREIALRWESEVHDGRRLVPMRQTDRAQLFVVDDFVVDNAAPDSPTEPSLEARAD